MSWPSPFLARPFQTRCSNLLARGTIASRSIPELAAVGRAALGASSPCDGACAHPPSIALRTRSEKQKALRPGAPGLWQDLHSRSACDYMPLRPCRNPCPPATTRRRGQRFTTSARARTIQPPPSSEVTIAISCPRSSGISRTPPATATGPRPRPPGIALGRSHYGVTLYGPWPSSSKVFRM